MDKALAEAVEGEVHAQTILVGHRLAQRGVLTGELGAS